MHDPSYHVLQSADFHVAIMRPRPLKVNAHTRYLVKIRTTLKDLRKPERQTHTVRRYSALLVLNLLIELLKRPDYNLYMRSRRSGMSQRLDPRSI